MKTKFALMGIGLIGVIWAQNQLSITDSTPGSTAKVLQFDEIQSAQLRPDSIIFRLVGGGRYASPTLGQKWVFATAFSSSVQISSSELSFQTQGLKMSVTKGVLQLESVNPVQVQILTVNGQVLASSDKDVKSWQSAFVGDETRIVRIRDHKSSKSYLLRGIQ